MNVIRAEAMGMCGGVRNALAVAAQVDRPGRVTIPGELVHNEVALAQLRARGFHMTAETDRMRLPGTPVVLITAHGVSDREQRRLQAAGKQLIDTTCPLVRRVQRAAKALVAEGYYVLVIGCPGHVEVRGIVEDLSLVEIVPSAARVRCYPHDRLGIVCQTTTPPRLADEIRLAIGIRNPRAEIRFLDTICKPTRARQAAVVRMLPQVDAVVVVGGRNSNNSQALVELCCDGGVPARLVQSFRDINPTWFRHCQTVGLTAGTSTLDSTIREVHEALVGLNAAPRWDGSVINGPGPAAGVRDRQGPVRFRFAMQDLVR